MTKIKFLACLLFLACSPTPNTSKDPTTREVIGTPADSAPVVTFTSNGTDTSILRSNQPASFGSTPSVVWTSGQYTLAYGGWLIDLNNDGHLDYYAVNHGQNQYVSGHWYGASGLFTGNGSTWSKNIFNGAVRSAPTNGADLNQSNELIPITGDFDGDGNVDIAFYQWLQTSAFCHNRGTISGSDWSGPGFDCYSVPEIKAAADVNNDGKPDLLTVDYSSVAYSSYKSGYTHTMPVLWRLNNGNADPTTWPTTTNIVALRPTDPNAFTQVPEFVDVNKDGIPDKIQGVETSVPSTGGLRLYLGQANGTYQLVNSGVDSVTYPVVTVEDVNEDGCIDIGVDSTGYRQNQDWKIQTKTGGVCTASFTAVSRPTIQTTYGYYPGFRRYNVDIDNDGTLDKVVIIHNGYGDNDGRPPGVNIFRRKSDGTFNSGLSSSSTGVNIDGNSSFEFYADMLMPGDWNEDGRLDLAGSGQPTITHSDLGFALWTSTLNTTNRYVRIQTPDIKGFFTGAGTIEIFDTGFVGDSSHLVTPVKTLRTGKAWPNQVYLFGTGTRMAVDIRVTFPDGRVSVTGGVSTTATGTHSNPIVITPIANNPPVAAIYANPTTTVIGNAVAFDGSGSTDSDGTIVNYAWNFGDGNTDTGVTTSHAYSVPGSFVAQLTVTDNNGAINSTTVGITVSDVTAPTVSFSNVIFGVNASDNVAVTGVVWSVDGVVTYNASSAPWSFTYDYANAISGPHQISAQACDAANNCSSIISSTIQK